ncbi:DUF6022 family protein [Bacillus sp. CGMCC 1.60114]|uniref:DUF6022 family protein n=1 Tax=unclassified Bacillus (in: firmicutes) TaxID=185979 RepID=UPI003641ADF4
MGELSLAFKPDMSIKEIGRLIENHVISQWKRVLEENYDEFLQSYEKIGEPTYGLYSTKLMTPVFDQFKMAGFIVNRLNLHDSLEEWGPIEKRDRMLWSVVKNQQNNPIGTFILDLFHNHTQFEIPTMPRIFILSETSRENIIKAVRQIRERA